MLRKKIILLCLFIGLISYFPSLLAQNKTNLPEVSSQHFNKKELETLRKNPDYQYEKVNIEPNLWQKFKNWIRELLYGSMDSEAKQNVWNWIFIIFGGIVLALVVIKFSGADIRQFFSSGSPKRSQVLAMNNLDDWQEADFDQQIQKALAEGNFDLTVRWLYLKTLKGLEQKKLIRWQKDKTNQEYVKELASTSLHQEFQSLTVWFEYVHYGDFELGESDFKIINDEFNQFFQALNATNINR